MPRRYSKRRWLDETVNQILMLAMFYVLAALTCKFLGCP